MILKTFVLGHLENNNFLLIDENSQGINEAVLIDATEYSEEIANTLNEYNAKLKYIILTHGHFDHILGVNDYKRKFDCEVLLYKEDKILLGSVDKFIEHFGLQNAEIPKVDKFIDENEAIKFGKSEIKVIHTPGHTAGGICLLIEDNIFTGDTLFFEAVGRTDLPSGSYSQLISSIQNKLFTLDENIKVYPGHGRSSTIGYEKINNKFL